jgi:peptidoglycan-associated lipoprotein
MLLMLVALAALLAGCGASKSFVQDQIKESESRTGAQIATLRDKTDANAAEVARLQQLATELSGKADMALNEAKGFETYQIIWSGEIGFDFDSWEITGAAEAILMEAGEKMEEVPGSVIEFIGHTDRTGSAKYNLMLGEKRAEAAKRFLAERFGVSLYRMFTVSYGEDKPIAMPDEKNAASRNRRVSLKIWGNQ